MTSPRIRYLIHLTGLSLAYTLLAAWSMRYFAPAGEASLIWPASGLGLAALLLGGARYWPVIFVGELLGSWLITGTLALSIGFGIGNVVGGMAGMYLIRHLHRGGLMRLQQPSDFFVLAAGASIASLIAALAGSLSFWQWGSYAQDWTANIVHWWQGDVLGILIVTPVALAIRYRHPIAWRPQLIMEALVLGTMTIVLCIDSVPVELELFVLAEREAGFFILVVWAALRFGLSGVLLLICSVVLLILQQYVQSPPQVINYAFNAQLEHFWIFVFTLSVVGITLALNVRALAAEKGLALGALAAEEDINARFSQAQTLSQTGCWELDIPSGQLVWSDEIFRIFEIDKQLFGASYDAFLNAIHPDDRAMVQQAYESSLQNHTRYEITHRLCMKDGRIKWVAECCETYYDNAGNALKSIGTVHDITLHKQKEDAALIANEARLRAIFETVTDAIVIINEQGIIEMANPPCEKIFGYSCEEMCSAHISLLMPARYAQEHDSYLAAYAQQGRFGVVGMQREISARRGNGEEFPIEICLERTMINNQPAYVGVIRDITERKKAEAALRDAKVQAETANLAKSQFLATMTHELRTPLNSVLGMLQLVLMEDITERQRSCLQTGQKSGQHLLDMINNILDYTKIEAGKVELRPTDVNLYELVQGIVAIFSPQADDKHLQLSLDIAATVPRHIQGDALRLKQVLINLLQNALKFTPQGQIQVTLGWRECDHADGCLHFEIRDSGIGISREECRQLFQLFYQVDNSITRRFGGTGLGLAICRQLVELMGGRIGVDSEPAQGSVFWFEIPCQPVQRAALAAAPGNPLPPHRQLHGVRILLCDADPTLQKGVSRMLLGRGALVSFAATSDELQDQLARQRFDLVLLGDTLAITDAAVTIQATVRGGPLPVIVMQADAAAAPAWESATAVVAKPVTAERLLSAVDAALPA